MRCKEEERNALTFSRAPNLINLNDVTRAGLKETTIVSTFDAKWNGRDEKWYYINVCDAFSKAGQMFQMVLVSSLLASSSFTPSTNVLTISCVLPIEFAFAEPSIALSTRLVIIGLGVSQTGFRIIFYGNSHLWLVVFKVSPFPSRAQEYTMELNTYERSANSGIFLYNFLLFLSELEI